MRKKHLLEANQVLRADNDRLRVEAVRLRQDLTKALAARAAAEGALAEMKPGVDQTDGDRAPFEDPTWMYAAQCDQDCHLHPGHKHTSPLMGTWHHINQGHVFIEEGAPWPEGLIPLMDPARIAWAAIEAEADRQRWEERRALYEHQVPGPEQCPSTWLGMRCLLAEHHRSHHQCEARERSIEWPRDEVGPENEESPTAVIE